MGTRQRAPARSRRRTALFDLYGTLVDLELDESSVTFWESMAAALGLSEATSSERDATRLLNLFRELCDRESRHRGEGNILRPVFAELLRQAGREATTTEIQAFARRFRRGSVKRLTLRPYARPLISRLRAEGVQTGLVSNTEALLTVDDLDRLQMRDLFDGIVLSSDVDTKKPDPTILGLILARLDTTPAGAVMVGDSWDTDVKAGLDAGTSVVCLDPGVAPGPPEVDTPTGVLRAHPDLHSCELALQALGFLPPD